MNNWKNLDNNYNVNNIKELTNIIFSKYKSEKLYKLFEYSIEKILTNYNNPDLKNFKPKDGYEFIDKSNYNEPLGIYHSHLLKIDSKLIVLVWYFRENQQNYYEIIFDILPHPTDDYKEILENIKKDKLTLNPNTWKNFSEKIIFIKTFIDFKRIIE